MSAAAPGKMRQAPASTWQVPEAPAVAVDSEDPEPKKQALVPDVEKILVAGELVAVSRARNDVEEKDERVKINRVENYHGSSAGKFTTVKIFCLFHGFLNCKGGVLDGF